MPDTIKRASDADDAPSVKFEAYDDEGRLQRRSDLAGVLRYWYWPNGLLKYVVEKTGQGASRSYQLTYRTNDTANRLTQYRQGAAQKDATAALVTDANGEPQFDTANASVPAYTIGYHYYANGALYQLTYPGGRIVSYDYDTLGRLWHVYDDIRTTTYAYDGASSLIQTVTNANGTVRTYGYDDAGQLTSITDKTSGGSLIQYQQLRHDEDGHILFQMLYPKLPQPGLASDAMEVDEDNRVSTWNGQATVFDADGNMTSGPLPNGTMGAYSYDGRSRLTGCAGSNYVYNPDGLRVQITGTGAATFQMEPAGGIGRTLVRMKDGRTTFYIYGAGLLYEDTAGTLRQYHFDQVGSAIAVTDGGQAVTDRLSYQSYGQVATRSGSTDLLFQFNGEAGVETETNGLCYMRARFYHPRMARFLNADPIGFDGGVNWYAFCGSNPIGSLDPSGLACTDSRGRNGDNGPVEGGVRRLGEVIIWIDRRSARGIADSVVAAVTPMRTAFHNRAVGAEIVVAPNKPDCAKKLAALANAQKLIQNVRGNYAGANAQFLADARANESLGAAFSDSPVSNASDARRAVDIGVKVLDENEVMGPTAAAFATGSMRVFSSVAAGVSIGEGAAMIANGDNAGWAKVGWGGASASITVGRLMVSTGAGGTPLAGSAAMTGAVTVASNATMVGGVAYMYFIGGTRLYYKNQDYNSSLRAVDSIGKNLTSMTKSYGEMVKDAKASGCL